ncbi:hypothetical protein FRX31_027880 [Thalictrum thalictroides]|uniref:Uncharacterized protein n=1 Tax=Thalictrum thalictroides TaxID=46969 RepID=A0A7J6VE86_THATH|nr:hypothetical protein FRX31_027880 [Thalictrum thalictroides]
MSDYNNEGGKDTIGESSKEIIQAPIPIQTREPDALDTEEVIRNHEEMVEAERKKIAETKHAMVGECIEVEHNNIRWNLQLRRRTYEWEEEQEEQLMAALARVQLDDGDDTWRWSWDKHGCFSVKSFYKELFNRARVQQNMYKVRLSVWNAMTDPLPAVFPALFTVSSIEKWLLQWPVVTNHEWGSLVWKYLPYATLWTLWKTRNNKTFRNTEIGVERICREIKFTIWYWCSSWKRRKKYKYQDLEDNWAGVIRGLIGPV